VPFEEGRLLASLIPGARLITLDTDNHVLLGDEPAFRVFAEALESFLRGSADEAAASAGAKLLTSAERAVLRLVVQGKDNHAIAAALGKSEKTLRNQVSSIFDKLGVRTRAEAIVRIRDGDFAH
jgi:DNA-binding NarL/FixJ family response regulator